LAGGVFVPIEADSAGYLNSRELALNLCIGEGHVQFYRLDTGQRLLARAERAAAERERADREAERAQREAEARQALEAELARLRAELQRRDPPDADS
jgi:hypothetical protein